MHAPFLPLGGRGRPWPLSCIFNSESQLKLLCGQGFGFHDKIPHEVIHPYFYSGTITARNYTNYLHQCRGCGCDINKRAARLTGSSRSLQQYQSSARQAHNFCEGSPPCLSFRCSQRFQSLRAVQCDSSAAAVQRVHDYPKTNSDTSLMTITSASSQRHVVIASKNPVKVNATVEAFKQTFPIEDFVFEAHDAKSGANEQPMTDEETLRGARNRVKHLKEGVALADYVVAIEGGVEWCTFTDEPQLMAFAWAVVLSKDCEGLARTAAFMLPPPIAELISGGMELGEADDQVFGRSRSGQKNGAVGILTEDAITRQTYYEHAITLALIPFINPKLYSSPSVPELPAGSLPKVAS